MSNKFKPSNYSNRIWVVEVRNNQHGDNNIVLHFNSKEQAVDSAPVDYRNDPVKHALREPTKFNLGIPGTIAVFLGGALMHALLIKLLSIL